MALMRVTPATALLQVRQVGYDLRRAMSEAGPLAAAPQFAAAFAAFEAGCAADAPLPVEVWPENGASPEDTARWLVGDVPTTWADTPGGGRTALAVVADKRLALTFASAARPSSSVPGSLAPPLLVSLETNPDTVSRASDRYLYVATTVRLPAPGPQQIVVTRSDAPGVLARLAPAPAIKQAFDLLHAASAAQAADGLAAIAGLAFEQETRSIRARRVLLQQRPVFAQARVAPQAPADQIASLRLRIQRTFAEFARGIEDRLSAALVDPSSAFSLELEESLARMDRLAEERRSRAIATTLAAEDEEAWLRLVRETVTRHCNDDLAAMRDMLRSAADDLQKAVTDAGGPPVVAQWQPLADDRVRRVVDTALRPQRHYEGTIPQHGFYEYAMMARRYQMIVFMTMSAFGLSFLRSYPQFMVPAAVVLLSGGTLHVVHSVRRERVEQAAHELEKAREMLRGETRRIVGELARSWVQLLSQHLSDQLPLVLGSAEASLREQVAHAANEGAEERQRLQRQLQGLEAAERKLAMPQKAREGAMQAIGQMRGELRQMVAAALQGRTVPS